MIDDGLWHEPQRRRLVQLCAVVSGERDAAEDLAQETLLEAWRNVHKLHDPSGVDRWLAAIARNVCRRWARRHGRDAALVRATDEEPLAADAVELEVELERTELVELLGGALALLPPETREVLIQRYVHDLPHAEIAARLGVSEDAVSMRLSRGKVVLRRLLGPQLGAVDRGVATRADVGWRETRVWCSRCGRRTLVMRSEPPPGTVAFRCPGCNPEAAGSEYPLGNPVFARLVGSLVRPTAILGRAHEWSLRYFAGGAGGGAVECTRCARPVAIRRYVRADARADGRHRAGLVADCLSCGEQVSSSLGALALATPEVRRLRREHRRTQALPEREVSAEGVPALAVRYESLFGSAGVDVLFARDTLRVLHAAAATA